MAFQLRRGTDAERTAGGGIVFAEGELVYITDTEEVFVGDGVTAGGILVTSNSSASPAALTRNLALSGFEINGAGDIDITGDITITGSISASNLAGGGTGVIEGQQYGISIQGDVVGIDSSIIVDSINGAVYADFIGDGSGITDIQLDQLTDVDTGGVVANDVLRYNGTSWEVGNAPIASGQDYEINIVGSVKASDSTVIIDETSKTGKLDVLEVGANNLKISNATDATQVDFSTADDANLLNIVTTGTDLSAYAGNYGKIQFGKDDDSETRSDAAIVASDADMRMTHDTVSSDLLDETKHFTLKEGKFGFGTYTPTEKIDVRGNAAFINGSLRFTDSRAIADITDEAAGDLKWEPNELTHVWYDNSDWYKIVGTNLTNNLTKLEAGIKLGLNVQEELDAFLEDSTEATGAIAYNEDTERFEFFQAGSWVKLINAGTETGQLVQWNSTDNEWQHTDHAEPSPGQILEWNGSSWAPADNAGGSGGGGGAFTNIGITADDSTVRLVNEGETIGILGGTNISTTSDVEGNITITNDFTQDFTYASLTGTPTTLAGYGITDAVLSTSLGNFTFSSSTLDTSDSSGITITPAVTIQSDLTVENDLRVDNVVYAERFESTTTGTPEIEAATNLNLKAGNAVVITSSPLRMASFTTAERDALASQNGDTIYNETTNKFQGYANGAWVDLH